VTTILINIGLYLHQRWYPKTITHFCVALY
jgi:hypothetical protein